MLQMPRTLYWILALACIYAAWLYILKPMPNLADLPHVVTAETQVQKFGPYTVTELEHFEGDFRILGREDYRFGREAKLSPIDFAVGWGKMADPAIYQQISVRQSNRWYYWRTALTPPLPVQEIITHSANIHIIPANSLVAKQLKRIKKDDLVYLSGALVEITSEDGWHWRSSLSRDDTGNGACELLRVDLVQLK